jgi:hypothetical protein
MGVVPERKTEKEWKIKKMGVKEREISCDVTA